MPEPVPPRSQRRRVPWLLASVPDAPALSRLWWVTGPVLLALLVAFVVVLARPVPYISQSPGGARPVEDLVTIRSRPGGPTIRSHDADGDLLYLTVSVKEPTAFEALLGVVDDDVDVYPSKPYYGTQTRDENRRLNLALMTESQDKARRVALERLGHEVKATPVGAFIEDVGPEYPVADVLKPGATVVGVDGKEVRTKDQFVDAIGAHEPGDRIDLEFIPLGEAEERTERVRLVADEADSSRAVLGVYPATRFVYTYPVDIDIDTKKVGGPSAGLAFTLAILDRMTPGPLLGDARVAVTGTIELDGDVGPVGGVKFKTRAAIREGADLMLVPDAEYDEARSTARGRLDVVAVSTLDEALAALKDHGGTPLPRPARSGLGS